MLLTMGSCSPTPAEKAASALARRIVPAYASRIRFREVKDTADFYELSMDRRGLRIRGNSALSMAVGLNRYLRDWCLTDVSWHAFDPVQVPGTMPLQDTVVRGRAIVPERFFLNYCTFGYTMPWWRWEDWERMIDWMALHGVNMPLATTGQEAVWQRVWRRHGLTDEEIRAFFTGPAHLPWHRMCNIDALDGPLPQPWIDAQLKLQQQIVARERSLGMRPVLPAFGGHVPARLKELYPKAQITDITRWVDMPPENLCHFLHPADSLYRVIQREYLQEQTRLTGTDHLYGFDLFNEIEPPSWDPETLADIGRNAYGSLSEADPEAEWIQMGWMFHNDRRHWSPENVKAYLEAIPQGKVTILDYYLEHTPVWTLTDSFYGQPYILCYLGNFGGNTRLSGPFHKVSERWKDARERGGTGLKGVGCTLEGFGVNAFLFEYMLDCAWETGTTDAAWVEALSDRRTGFADATARRAWKDLTDSVYVHGSISEGLLMCGRPCLEGWKQWTVIHTSYYPHRTLERIWKELLTVDSDRDSYRFDIVNIGCQVLGNRFADERDRFTACLRARDAEGARAHAERMMELFRDAERLAACEPQFSLDRWISDASAWGLTPEEAAYYRHNARHLLTTWGGPGRSLLDYASRFWAGLASRYYAPRWQRFLGAAIAALENGQPFDETSLDEAFTDFERGWVEEDFLPEPHVPGASAPEARTLARSLCRKYGI